VETLPSKGISWLPKSKNRMTIPIQIVGSVLRRGEVTTGRKGSASKRFCTIRMGGIYSACVCALAGGWKLILPGGGITTDLGSQPKTCL
jgi:hypothetical protein